MSGDGRAIKTGAYGRWDFSGAPTDMGVDVSRVESPPEDELPLPERTVGAGTEAVYVYGYPVYRRVAAHQGEAFYPCKIGRTSFEASVRVFGQATTAMPEWPAIWLVILTDNSRVVERMLHAVLVLRGRAMDEAPGAEWFLTNPDEVESIHSWACGGHIDDDGIAEPAALRSSFEGGDDPDGSPEHRGEGGQHPRQLQDRARAVPRAVEPAVGAVEQRLEAELHHDDREAGGDEQSDRDEHRQMISK
jgi:hypothetical protein